MLQARSRDTPFKSVRLDWRETPGSSFLRALKEKPRGKPPFWGAPEKKTHPDWRTGVPLKIDATCWISAVLCKKPGWSEVFSRKDPWNERSVSA